MRNIMLILWQYVRSFFIIYLCLYIGLRVELLLPVPIAGSIIGMLLLFILLTTQIIPLHWVKLSCHLLVRYMALLFVPICVSIMNYTEILINKFDSIIISCVISTLIVLVTVGVLSQYIHTNSIRCMESKKDE